VTPECLLSWAYELEMPLVDVLKASDPAVTLDSTPRELPGFCLLATKVEGLAAWYDVRITLDPLHDFLPRGILMTQSTRAATRPGWYQNWTIERYQPVTDERTGKKRWFPAAGTLTEGGKAKGARPRSVKLTLSAIHLNPKPDATEFHPKFPGTTQFDDRTTEAQQKWLDAGP
jgi:hypothetical protein